MFGFIAAMAAAAQAPAAQPAYLPDMRCMVAMAIVLGAQDDASDSADGPKEDKDGLIGLVMRFPPAGAYPLEVRFAPSGGREKWTRRFGPNSFSSEMSEGPGGTLTERFGPMRFHFALDVAADGALAMRLARWSAFG